MQQSRDIMVILEDIDNKTYIWTKVAHSISALAKWYDTLHTTCMYWKYFCNVPLYIAQISWYYYHAK